MIYIHHLTNSRSQRVIWLLEELGIEYQVIIHARDRKTRQAPKSLYQIHTLGKAPILFDQTLKLAETGAIFDYLVETYGKNLLAPAAGSPDRVHYLYWKNFAEASLMPYLALTQVFARITRNMPLLLKPMARLIAKKVNTQYLYVNLTCEINLIEQHLKTNKWFAGDQFSAADILMGFMLDALAGRFITELSYPNIDKFVAEMKTRPAYQSANDKGQWSANEFNQYWNHLKV